MEDDNDFNKDIHRLFEKMTKEMARIMKDKIESGEIDDTIFKHGFKVEIGPNGTKFLPMDDEEIEDIENLAHEEGINHKIQFHGKMKRWKNPLTDVFTSDQGYQIISDLRGISTKDINIEFKNSSKLLILAENYEVRYKKIINLKRSIDPQTLAYSVKNGVLELNLNYNIKKTIEQ